jgi:hypothetical protein
MDSRPRWGWKGSVHSNPCTSNNSNNDYDLVTLTEHSLYPSFCAKHFTYVISLNKSDDVNTTFLSF